jgi:hypothetical protein
MHRIHGTFIVASLLAPIIVAGAHAQLINDAAEKQRIIDTARAIVRQEMAAQDMGLTAKLRSESIARSYDSLWDLQGMRSKAPAAPAFSLELQPVSGARCTIDDYKHLRPAAQKEFEEKVDFASTALSRLLTVWMNAHVMALPPDRVDIAITRESAGYSMDYTVTTTHVHVRLRDDFRMTAAHLSGSDTSEGITVTCSYVPVNGIAAMDSLTYIIREKGETIAFAMRGTSSVINGAVLPTRLHIVVKDSVDPASGPAPEEGLDDVLTIGDYTIKKK